MSTCAQRRKKRRNFHAPATYHPYHVPITLNRCLLRTLHQLARDAMLTPGTFASEIVESYLASARMRAQEQKALTSPKKVLLSKGKQEEKEWDRKISRTHHSP